MAANSTRNLSKGKEGSFGSWLMGGLVVMVGLLLAFLTFLYFRFRTKKSATAGTPGAAGAAAGQPDQGTAPPSLFPVNLGEF